MHKKITDAIDEAIKSKSEKTFLDFKVQWHEKNELGNTSLVHDILCLCNCEYEDDRYLVIGIANEFYIKGVAADKNRRGSDDITNLMRNFNKIPKVEVREVVYQDEKLDVVIIKYDKHVRPFYIEKLSEPQRKVIDKNGPYKGLSAGSIYSRNNNTNTPRESAANKFEIEKMWREHFGIDKSALERFKIYLEKPQDWESLDKDEYYYKFFPEFRVIIEDFDKEEKSTFLKIGRNSWGEFEFADMRRLYLRYLSVDIYKGNSCGIYLETNSNEVGASIMHPEHKFFDENGLCNGNGKKEEYLFFFVFEDDFLYRISKFLIKKEHGEECGGVFCHSISEFHPDKFIFVLKNQSDLETTITRLSQDKEKMNLIKNDKRFIWQKKNP